MKQFTEKQAIEFAELKRWEKLPPRERAIFQLTQRRLCMPFEVFQEAIEEALGRSVWTHEFADWGKLRDELLGKGKKPSMKDIINMIPKDKLVIVGIDGDGK